MKFPVAPADINELRYVLEFDNEHLSTWATPYDANTTRPKTGSRVPIPADIYKNRLFDPRFEEEALVISVAQSHETLQVKLEVQARPRDPLKFIIRNAGERDTKLELDFPRYFLTAGGDWIIRGRRNTHPKNMIGPIIVPLPDGSEVEATITDQKYELRRIEIGPMNAEVIARAWGIPRSIEY